MKSSRTLAAIAAVGTAVVVSFASAMPALAEDVPDETTVVEEITEPVIESAPAPAPVEQTDTSNDVATEPVAPEPAPAPEPEPVPEPEPQAVVPASVPEPMVNGPPAPLAATTLARTPGGGVINNPNETAYWENQYSAHQATCYKYGDSKTPNGHGRIVKDANNKWSGVVLNPFDQNWPGDHWEVLIVNGGPNGDAVYEHPTAGTTYYTPGLNNQGKHYDVSHWIVCKGTTPEPPKVTPVPVQFTPPTCEAPGSVSYTDTAQYTYVRTGPDNAAVYTATPVGNVVLQGQTVFGPYDLTQLAWPECPPPPIPQCETFGSYELDEGDFVYSDTRATGHYRFTDDGLDIWTEGSTSTDKVALYWAIGKPLTDIGQPSIDYTADFGIAPGLQLMVDFDGNGTTDGILVGESVYGDNWWLSNSAAAFVKAGAPHTGGGNGSNWFGTLAEWRAAFPDNNVVLGGFSLGSGVYASGTIHSITMGCVTYTFKAPPKPLVCENIVDGGTVTNLNLNGWTVTNGTWTEDGLRLNSDNWVDATVSKSTSFNLTAARSLALDMDVSGAGNYGMGIVLHTAQGDLHWEDIYTDEFWSNDPVLPPTGGGQGGPYSGSLEDALETIGDVEVTSVTIVFSSATPNSAILNSATFNCTNVKFEYESVFVPANPKVDVEQSCGTAELTFSNNVGELGQYEYSEDAEFRYQVDDGEIVTVTVEPNGEPVTVPLSFVEDSGDHTVTYWEPGDEVGTTLTVGTDCKPNRVDVVDVGVGQMTCTEDGQPVNGAIEPPDSEHITYSIEGDVWLDLPAGDYTVTATPNEGYVLGDLPDGWTLNEDGSASTVVTINQVDCEQPPVEVTPPTPTVTHEVKVCVVPGYTVKTTSGSITIPAIENVTGVEALLDGKVVAFGKHEVAPGVHTVVYRSTNEGVVLIGQLSFTLEVKAATTPVCKAPDRPTPNNVHGDVSQLNPSGSGNGYVFGVFGAIAAMITAAGVFVFGRRLTQRRGEQG